ncbi:hypothetical protein ACJX0J_011468, partial [Zea mays]
MTLFNLIMAPFSLDCCGDLSGTRQESHEIDFQDCLTEKRWRLWDCYNYQFLDAKTYSTRATPARGFRIGLNLVSFLFVEHAFTDINLATNRKFIWVLEVSLL